MAHLEAPPPRPNEKWIDAIVMAKMNPGKWVFVREYANTNSAQATASRKRKRWPELEIRATKERIYLRVRAVETKGAR